MHSAASIGDPEIVEILLDAGADINKGNSFGTTPIYFAALREKIKVVELLIRKGAHFRGYYNRHRGEIIHQAFLNLVSQRTIALYEVSRSPHSIFAENNLIDNRMPKEIINKIVSYTSEDYAEYSEEDINDVSAQCLQMYTDESESLGLTRSV